MPRGTPMGALWRSLLIPGWGQAKLRRNNLFDLGAFGHANAFLVGRKGDDAKYSPILYTRIVAESGVLAVKEATDAASREKLGQNKEEPVAIVKSWLEIGEEKK